MFMLVVLLTALFLLAVDYLWIKLVMHDLYMSSYKELLFLDETGIKMNLVPAVLVYLLMLFSLFYFAVLPTLKNSYKDTFVKGALLGLYGYGLYDLTNQALFKLWDPFVSTIDMAWGGFLCAVTAVFAKKIYYILKA